MQKGKGAGGYGGVPKGNSAPILGFRMQHSSLEYRRPHFE